MRTHFRKYWITLLIISLVQLSCRSNGGRNLEEELYTALGIPAGEVNARFVVEAPGDWSTFWIGDGIGLRVRVNSVDEISFAYNFGARIFRQVEEGWLEIENSMRYPEGSIVLSSEPKPTRKAQIVVVAPVLTETAEPVTIKIVLQGHIYRDGAATEEITASAIDITLHPKPQPKIPDNRKS